MDVTEYARVAEQFDATRPVVGILQVDNYEDLNRGLEEGERSVIRTEINNRLAAWVDPAHGMLCRYDRDHYILLVEAGQFQDFYRRKFSILDEIRQVQSPNGVAATLSIGFGRNGASPRELHEFASLALDMALSRGGDQVVIRDGGEFLFFGGRSKETERRTKVKSRVVASAFSELLASTDQVIVMGHKYPDLDVLGAVAGVCAIARKKRGLHSGRPGPSPYPAEEQTRQLAALPEYQGIFVPPDEALHLAGPNTILVVVDTNRPEQTQVPELLDSGARIVVIDHHRRAASYIEKPALSFHDPYASSASELVAELVQYILDTGDLKRQEAEALLAGIVLDTKGFTMRTGSRTFETAAFLRKSGPTRPGEQVLPERPAGHGHQVPYHSGRPHLPGLRSPWPSPTGLWAGPSPAKPPTNCSTSRASRPPSSSSRRPARPISPPAPTAMSMSRSSARCWAAAATPPPQGPSSRGKPRKRSFPSLKNAIDTYFDDEKS